MEKKQIEWKKERKRKKSDGTEQQAEKKRGTRQHLQQK
jgi:hypothetical protein